MRSLPIVILFSLVSLVAAFGKKGHPHRNAHPRPKCHDVMQKQAGVHNQTGGMYNQTDGMHNQTDNQTGDIHNQTDGMHNQTDGMHNQTVGMNNQTDSQTVGTNNQTDGLHNQTDGTNNQTDGMHNQTVGTNNQTDAMDNQTDIKQNSTVTKGSRYQLVDQYTGKDFLDETKWSAFTQPDFTHGLVEYVSQDTARSEGMTSVLASGAAIISVDNKTDLSVNTPRKSMRITTTKKYNGGLFIADFEAMPFGCSLWPAYWSYGTESWPTDGEIDILEGVNNQVTNQMTLHTGPNCSIDEHPETPFSGNVLSTDCESPGNNNAGCAFGDSDPSSYGPGFNAAGGGVYAHLWNKDGIKIWHFKRSSIPQDITSGSPDPSTWPTPVAFWSNTGCNTAEHFIDHSLVIDTTLCGDWAGNSNVYGNSGCPGTCAQAVSEAANFKNAYWQVNYISVYTSG